MKLLNRYKTIVLAVSFLTFDSASSQKATLHFIDSILLAKDISLKSTRGVVYVVNGIPEDTPTLHRVLGNFETRQLLDVTYLIDECTPIFPCYVRVAIIVFAENHSTQLKRGWLKSKGKMFSDTSKIPILQIDNSIIEPAIAKKTFQSLEPKDILYVDTVPIGGKNRIRVWKIQTYKTQL